jgi:homoserine kinase
VTSTTTQATVFSPAGVGNVGVGFDILGHGIHGVGDRVIVRRLDEPVVRIAAIRGIAGALPTRPEENTASAGLVWLIRELELPFGFEIEIEKGIPLGSGMGGSAASAVGAIVAANALLADPLTPLELFRYALIGETVASGSAHGDNLAPGLFGGLTLVRSMDPPDVVRIPVPEAIRCVLVYPHARLDTKVARGILPTEVPMKTHIAASANLAAFVAGCLSGDLELIGRSLHDVLVEPHRERLVPGFRSVKAAALESGALGCSISGAGPSLFAWCAGDRVAERVRDAMRSAFAAMGLESEGWVSPVNGTGAEILEVW